MRVWVWLAMEATDGRFTLVAHALHAVGSRAGKKFVLVSCSAAEEEALTKRLFGPMQPEDGHLPAIEEARTKGFHVTGPEPPDTVFVAAMAGKYDAVLALYHDQGFIPVKLAAPTTCVTVLLGMPYLRVSPAHGTAFDIAGKGVASPENLITALLQAAAWIPGRA